MRAVTFILLFCIAFTVCAATGESFACWRVAMKGDRAGTSGSEWRWCANTAKSVWRSGADDAPLRHHHWLNDYGGINADFTGLVAENLA